jgi:hypothetical protein
VTSIAALSVQSLTRRPAVNAPAPVAAEVVQTGTTAAAKAAKDPAPAAPLVARETLSALIAAQAEHGHTDPQPDHGRDDAHGHQPAPQPVVTPPVVTPPVVSPPEVTPPLTPPPVVQPPAPPHVQPAPAADPALPARTIAMVERVLSEGRVAEAERSAFAAAAAQRRAATTIAQGHAALAILSTLQTEMAGYRDRALGRRV